jgi:hypothetical protein
MFSVNLAAGDVVAHGAAYFDRKPTVLLGGAAGGRRITTNPLASSHHLSPTFSRRRVPNLFMLYRLAAWAATPPAKSAALSS